MSEKEQDNLNEEELKAINLQWLREAACKDTPSEEFFVPAGKNINPEIKKLCEGCPVRRECLIYAYLSKDPQLKYGFFAGLSVGMRNKLTLEEALALIDKQQNLKK